MVKKYKNSNRNTKKIRVGGGEGVVSGARARTASGPVQDTSNLVAKPMVTSGFQYGTSPNSNSFKFQQAQNEKQAALNKTFRGGMSSSSRAHTTEIEVPQFQQNGPNIGGPNPNTLSLAINKGNINTINDAAGDCWATNTCSPAVTTGGRRRGRKFTKRGGWSGEKKTRQTRKKQKKHFRLRN